METKTTKTQILSIAIQTIFESHKNEISFLPTVGPRGGRNGRGIPGWENYGKGTITRAANMTSMPVLPYWSGVCPTPSSCLPSCVKDDVMAAYNDIFGGDGT